MSRVSTAKPRIVEAPRESAGNTDSSSSFMAGFLVEKQFRRMLTRERKRSERSRKHLVLMLIDGGLNNKKASALLERVAAVLCTSIRETDLAGWFESNSVFGVIFTEFGDCDVNVAVKIIESKVASRLQNAFKATQLSTFQISFYAFPDGWEGDGHQRPVDPTMYPDLFEVKEKKRLSLLEKRAMDVVGGALALVFLSPVFLVLAMLIKLTSEGPIFFRQERVGQFGSRFVFLKFRSMYVSTNATIHKDFVRKFIAGKSGQSSVEGKKKVYKITDDPRVTWIGRFMRRTSLDEIPQFWNVLRGEMSLVGPRPPIPYEIETYDIWHRRRLLESRPGITGLWQVHGRSKTTFDEMVRLDLQYSRMWSPLLDLKILLQTPRAVFSGDGAY